MILGLALLLSVATLCPLPPVAGLGFGLETDLASAAQLLTNPQSILPQSTETLVREAGYIPEVHYIPTGQRGYEIQLVHIVNPLIKRLSTLKKRLPILFVHGLVLNSNAWLVMGQTKKGKAPQNWSNHNETLLGEQQLELIVKKDRASRSLPYLMSNFGHDVWLMNRRNTRESRLASPKWYRQNGNKSTSMFAGDKSTFRSRVTTSQLDPINVLHDLGGKTIGEMLFSMKDSKLMKLTDLSYFDYSYDEQAKYDLPAAIKFVLKETKRRKLNIVGHSAGGLLTIMMLAAQPKMASKINHAAMLAPSINLHYNNLKSLFFQLISGFELIFSTSIGSLNGIEFILVALIVSILPCAKERFMGYPCSLSLDEAIGFGTTQFDLGLVLGTVASWTDDSSLHEMAQLIQSGFKNQIHYLDFRDPLRNVQAYSGLNVPKYNLTAVSLDSMSIWQGNTDRLVNQFDTFTLLGALKNSWDYHFIGNVSDHILLNHLGFHFHEDVTDLVNIPILSRIGSAGYDD